jgi:glycosyltransferase involved in cell wall biosynthesis
MPANARTFAFIKMGEFSHANHFVLEQLRARFPELEASVVDVGDLHVIRKADVPGIMLAIAREFGVSACVTGERVRRHMGKTKYLFLRMREALLQHLQSSNHAFTFQTQSLFDASCPGTPHFIYTDHTHLENFRYPISTAATPLSRSWAELERSAYRNASMVFTMSGNISRSLIEDYGCPAQRVECVYAGSNVSAATFESIDSARFRSKNILFVGLDWERKGGPVLLDAFRRLRHSHPDARLTIVGCSPQIHEHGVEVVGRVSLTEVAQFYRKASIFCLPTLNEPFGLVFLEAFSYGLPIVATRLGAIPEIVSDGESGFLVAPLSSGQLADALSQLLCNPVLCEQFGAVGRQLVMRRYSWEKTGQTVASHIEHVVKLEPHRSFDFAQPPVPAAACLAAV